jgi:hypothetical protein
MLNSTQQNEIALELENKQNTSKFSLMVNSIEFSYVVCALWLLQFAFGIFGIFEKFKYLIFNIISILKGNGLIVFIAIKFKKLNDMMNCFILNLALTDILYSLFCIPVSSTILFNCKYN